MPTLQILPASDRPGVILSGQGTDLWFLSLADAKSYAEHVLRLSGGRTELRDHFGNLIDWFEIAPASDDSMRFF
jgi:hypothetical protein